MSEQPGPAQGGLHVIAIVADPTAVGLLERALHESGDTLSLGSDLTSGLQRVANQPPDVAFVDVTLGDGAGLAVVHHVRALSPNTAVFAVTKPDALALGTQATALGAQGTLVLPLSGDDVLTALSAARSRRVENSERERLSRLSSGDLAAAALASEIAEIADSETLQEAAGRLSRAIRDRLGASSVAVYFGGVGEAARQLRRVSNFAGEPGEPAFASELELLRYARAAGLEILRLSSRREQVGLVLVGGVASGAISEGKFALVTSLASLAVAVVAARDSSARGAMKDPRSSAYTFAYFVDVAGREIDMARRHGRRFALATIGVQDMSGDAGRDPASEVADRVLAAVRDTDVLARVEEDEFYLLLPETGGIGAQVCRRRLLEQIEGASRVQVAFGLATFPHDGTDLLRLLRAARHRADSSLRSAAVLLGLPKLSFVAQVDTLLGATLPTRDPRERLDAPHYIELPEMDAVGLAIAAVREAVRGGDARVIVTSRPGISLGGAVRAAVVRELEGARLDVVDLGRVAGAADIELLAVVAQHATYVLVGRSRNGLVRAVHSADPVLVDALLARLAEVSGTRLFDA